MMITRRCELCKRRIPAGLRLDARFCSANCRVNAHKQRQRESKKIELLTPQPVPTPTVLIPTIEWSRMIEFMQTLEPECGAIGYRLARFSEQTRTYNYFPNPASWARLAGKELRTEYYYWWKPFEPPSVPEIGFYQLQFIGKDGRSYPPDAKKGATCLVPMADPQARYHGNRPPKDTAPAVLRQQAALIARTNKPKK